MTQGLPVGGTRAFLRGNSEMAARIRAFDWSATRLGAIDAWPYALKAFVGFILGSRQPMTIAWGSDGLYFYNDAFIPLLGRRHPRALGSAVTCVWPEMETLMPELLARVFAGEAVQMDDVAFLLDTHGVSREAHFAFACAPIRNEDGTVAGIITNTVETTRQHQLMSVQQTALEALRLSEERLRLATEAAEVGFWETDNLTKELFWPTRVKELFGIPPHVPVTIDEFALRVHPDDLEMVRAAYAAACDPEKRALYDVEFRTIDKEGGLLRWVAGRGRGVFDETGRCLRAFGTATDITARKMVETELRDLNESLERRVAERTAERDRVWRNSRDLLFVMGADGLMRAANPAFEDILGYAPEEVVGRHCREFILSADLDRAEQGLKAAYENDLTNYELRHNHKDGSLRWVSWHTSREGELLYGYGRDITGSKAQEKALAEAEAALRQAQKMEAMGQLTGGIAHDFNNLLQGVAGNLELIRRRPDKSESVRRWADAGLLAAQRGAKLTAQLLAFSRSQRLELKSLDLSALLSTMRELLGRTLGPSVRVVIDVDPGPNYVLGDETQLELAILNLAINARDAMPHGGELAIRTRRRRIQSDPELAAGDYVELTIADTGVGMAPDVLGRAFDPFFTTKGVGQGTGLGLSQVYGMTRQAGGVARIESAPGHGTTVRLFHRSTEPNRARQAQAEDKAAEEPSVAATVLVVDDDPDVRSFLVDSLDAMNYAVIQAEDGYAGLAALARSAPDLMIVDYAMPGITGAAVAEEARTRRADLPILFASGYADTAAIEDVLDENTMVLRKPFRISELQESVARLLRR